MGVHGGHTSGMGVQGGHTSGMGVQGGHTSGGGGCHLGQLALPPESTFLYVVMN